MPAGAGPTMTDDRGLAGPPVPEAPDAGLALLTPSQMAAADQAAIAGGTSGIVLMDNAGAAIAREIRRRFAPCPVVVAAGPGNNGGDGFVVARLLAEVGWSVRVALLGSRDQLTGDAALAARRWTGPVEPAEPAVVAGAGLIVDALFGAGLARPLDGAAAVLVAAIAQRGVPVVAVDLPSGVSGSTGAVLGIAAPATVTVSFFRAKPGHWLLPGRDFMGELVLADIGIGAEGLDAAGRASAPALPLVLLNHPSLWHDRLHRPVAQDHKYSRGRALVRVGTMPGAARLAAAAARRSGAGALVMVGDPAWHGVLGVDAPGVILAAPDAWAGLLADPRTSAALIGPGAGVGPATLTTIETAVQVGVPLVLDADALTILAQAGRRDIARDARAPIVMTPHAGEFETMFGDVGGEGRVARVRAAAAIAGAVVVLKGSDSVIATPDGRAAINTGAPPTLATAGTGDVLAGLVLGLIAQGMPAADAAAAAVWLHGTAAARLGGRLVAEDLAPAIARLLDDLAPVPMTAAPGIGVPPPVLRPPILPVVVDRFRLS